MIHLLLAIHNHQPVGNFGHVFEKAFKECYWPLLKTIAEFPKVKVSLHHSGPLLDWAREHEPDYLPALTKLIRAGQVEPLGGGYYEPILAVIPPNDAKGQIEMMRDFWKAESGVAPRGIWMTERIWEPSLASLLAENGVEYTILDDEHFRAAGVVDEYILNYYLTERHGKTTAIFASDQKLRYYIPFKMPEDVIGHLLYLADKYPGSAITYGDDGEKLGLWPGTFEWVVKKGWLKKFFQLLTENSEKIKCSTISEYFDGHKPSGTVYLPTCSYHEMGEWAMPAQAIKRFDAVKEFLTNAGKWEEAKPFVRGGYWDNFLTKYPESNYMHKRMLYVSEKLAAMTGKYGRNPPSPPFTKGGTSESPPFTKGGISPPPLLVKGGGGGFEVEALTNARKALYRAQCNCPYWHGLFGGLYLNYLRHAVYSNLIEAEKLIDSLATSHQPPVTKVDIDCDRSDEFILRNDKITAVIKPNRGAGLAELSHMKSGLNLQDVLARREEVYHTKKENQQKVEAAHSGIPSIHDLNKDPASAGKIVYDICERFSFLERIWPANASSSDVYKDATYVCKSPFELSSQKADSVTFTADVVAPFMGPTLPDKSGNYILTKTYFIGSNPDINVQFGLKFKDPVENEFRFGTELNLTLLAGHDDKRYYLLNGNERKFMDATGSLEGSDGIKLVDEYFGIKLQIKPDKKMDLWYFPVNTVSQSEAGLDLLYQGSCIIWSALIPKGTREFDFSIGLSFD